MKLFGKEKKEELYGAPIKKKKEDSTFLEDLIRMLFKVAIIGLCFVLIFTFIFGAFRYSDTSMTPAIKDGDMAISYRWDKRYKTNDLVVFWYEEKTMVGRVIGTAGEEVDIPASGITIDGHRISEPGITQETTQVKDGTTFPLKVPEGQVFVLGDNRTKAVDSRLLGCIDIDKTEGKVIGLFRHRGL